jgi:hypothetical protein
VKTTLRRFEKQIGNVRVAISEETADGGVSREIMFTRRHYDGSDVPSFSDEGDLAQLGMALWHALVWLNDRQVNQPALADEAA